MDTYQMIDQRHSQIDSDNDNTPTLSLDLEKESPGRTSRWNILRKYLRLGGGYLVAALPRYMHPGGLRRKKKKLLPTSYLDGLRGYAACVVVTRHRFDFDKTWIVQQPIVRLIHSGDGAVNSFFLISGYVLSYRLLMSMRNHDSARMLDSLASSTFRRYFRLYGSVCAATFICMLLVRFEWILPWTVQRKDTFMDQFWDWIQDFGRFSNPLANLEGIWYEDIFSARYLYVSWTIPLEFRGSMVLFAFCTAVCKLSTKHRMMLCWITIALCYYWRATYIALFLQGMFIADVSLGRHPERLKPSVQLPKHEESPTTSPPTQSISTRVGYVMMLIIALFLMGSPHEEDTSDPFPWQHLRKTIPQWDEKLEQNFWVSVGTFMLIFALESYPTLQKPLNTNFSQYLGDLSFGIYTMHQLVLWSLYERVLDPLRQQYLADSNWARVPGMVIFYLAVLWAAERFMRIDGGVVQLARYIQNVVFVQLDE